MQFELFKNYEKISSFCFSSALELLKLSSRVSVFWNVTVAFFMGLWSIFFCHVNVEPVVKAVVTF